MSEPPCTTRSPAAAVGPVTENVTRFGSTCVLAPSGAQFSADLGDETMILSLSTEMYYSLTAVGSRIWELIQEGHTVGEIEKSLVAEYDVDAERCRRDLQRFLVSLESCGMIATSWGDEAWESSYVAGR